MHTVYFCCRFSEKSKSVFRKQFELMRKFLLSIILIFQIALLSAQGPVSSAYHNMTSRFNSYFYARQRILEVESALKENYDWNYNRILPIYPQYDTTFSVAQKTPLEDCIKKASISIQRHPGSKWEYDSYILVGKARVYGSEFPEAIETFKYVNTRSNNKTERHRALVELLRAFVEANEFNNAASVTDFLRKEKLNAENQRKLYVNQAYLYQKRKDYDKTVHNLVQAEELMASGRERARINYIIGQIYQELGFEAEAYRFYKRTLKNGPEYELSFYTKLNMAQVTELTKNSDRKKVKKYFKNLLRDPKNIEYKDKIYYEMGGFELKQGNLPEAIDHYKSSVQNSTNNERQKAYSYLKLSEIYYDSLADYEVAKLYYDSTASVMPKDEEGYEAIIERQQILEEFVQHIVVVRTNDSLLTLSTKSDAELNEIIDGILDVKEAELLENKKKLKKEQRRTANRNNNLGPQSEGTTISTTTEGVWYFYNNSSISRGRSEFIRKWGQRELEDNWRRRNKATEVSTPELESKIVASEQVSEQSNDDEVIDRQTEKDKFFSSIPQSQESKNELLAQIEEAYYQIGNIYNFKLEEKNNAIDTFEKLIHRFDTSSYRPEVLYQLYLLYKNIDPPASNAKADQLLKEFPESIYSKLIFNPRYREESLALNQKIQEIYASAYDMFHTGNHNQSITLINNTLSRYEKSDYHDNLQLLKVMNQGRIDDIYKYQYELNNFIKNHPDSELGEYAKKLLKASEEYQINLFSSSRGRYTSKFNQKHYFILVYNTKPELTSNIPTEIDNFLNENNLKMTTGNLVLDEKYSMVLVNELPGKGSASSFLDLFTKSNNLEVTYKGEIFYPLVITIENFEILYESKDLKSYLTFFEKYY